MMAQMMQNHPQVCLLGLEKLKLHSTQFTLTKSQIGNGDFLRPVFAASRVQRIYFRPAF